MVNRLFESYLGHFDTDTLVIAATRYFIGRMTIAACAFAGELAAAWPEIPEHVRFTIKADIEDMFKLDDMARERGDLIKPLGMDWDRRAWEQVRAKWAGSRPQGRR